MFAQQQQMFAAQAQYSQQLSAQMPQPYGSGLGATGFGGGWTPNGYSYGASPYGGYGPGNSFGNSMTSAMGGIANAGFGMLPFMGGMAGFGMGGLGGGLLGAGLGFGVGAIGKHVVGSMMAGAQENAMMERTLSQFNFSNAESRTGRGFSRQDSSAISNMVRQMERIPEMMTSFGELNKLMDKMGQMGLMQGVKDAGEFQKKFRDTVSTLKEMSKVLGGTMEDALQALGEARRSGFYSNTDIAKNAMARRVTSALTGMDQNQIGGLQMYGGDLGHAQGGSRRTGAQFALRTAGQLGMANQMGILSNDQIMEMTGKEGAAGIQDLSASMTELGYKMGNSNVGQAMTLALGEVKDGRYTGRMDQALVEKVRRGELGLNELKQLARSKANTRGAKLSFAAHRDRLRSEMVGSVGTEGIGMQLQEILGDRGWNNPDATSLVMQRFGASEEQANLLQQMMPNLQSIGSQMNQTQRQEARMSAINASQREHGWDALKHRISSKLKQYTTDWAKDLGANVRDYFANWADDFMDSLSGQYRSYLTKNVASTFAAAASGSQRGQADLAVMQQHAIKLSQDHIGAMNAGQGSMPQVFVSGAASVGHKALRFLGLTGESVQERTQSLLSLTDAGKTTSLTEQNLGSQMSRFTELQSDKGGAAELGKMGDVGSQVRQAFDKAMTSGSVILEKDQAKRAQKIWDIMKTHLDSKTLQTLKDRGVFGLNAVAAMQSQARSEGKRYAGMADLSEAARGLFTGQDLTNQAWVSGQVKDVTRDLSKSLKGSSHSVSWGEVRKMMDDGNPLGKLIAGNDQVQGIAGGNDTLQRLLNNMVSGGKLDDGDLKMLQQLGIDPAALQRQLQQPGSEELVGRILGTHFNKSDVQNIKKYNVLMEASGLNRIAGELRSEGLGQMARLGGDTKALQGSKQGQQVLAMLQQQADRLTNAKTYGSYTEQAGDIAEQIAGLSESDRNQALSLAGDEDRAAYETLSQGRKRLGGKTGLNIDQVLKELNVSVDDSFKADLEKNLGSDKTLSSDAELTALLKQLGNNQAAGLRAKPGSGTESSQVSESDIAGMLQTSAKNQRDTATILGNIATGKPLNTGLGSN